MRFNYATEIMYNRLHCDASPVVFRDARYEGIVPENSVIKISDFPTPKDLIGYLINVSQSPSMYSMYLGWENVKYSKCIV